MRGKKKLFCFDEYLFYKSIYFIWFPANTNFIATKLIHMEQKYTNLR